MQKLIIQLYPVIFGFFLTGCLVGGASSDSSSDTSDTAESLSCNPPFGDPTPVVLGFDVINLYITVDAADNPESEEDLDCVGIIAGVVANDGKGHTLAQVNLDTVKGDGCQPEVNVTIETDASASASAVTSSVANARLRIRGQTSRFATQKSYRIKFKGNDPATFWRNEEILQINKHPWEIARVRQKLSYDLMNEIAGINTLRTQFFNVFIDDDNDGGFDDHGLYTHVERVNKTYLRSRGLDPSASVYKASSFFYFRYPDDLKLESDPTFVKEDFEHRLDIKEGSDHSSLLEMLDALNDYGQNFATVFSTYFDQNNYLTWLAINILFDNNDTNSQNYYIYSACNSKKFFLIPWDYDGAWDFWGQLIEVELTDGKASWRKGISNWWRPTLHKRFIMEPEFVELLTIRITEIKTALDNSGSITTYLDSYKAAARSIITSPPDLWSLPAFNNVPDQAIIDEHDANYATLYTQMNDHYDYYMLHLNDPMPIFMDESFNFTTSEVEFLWDASFDIQGDDLFYDFELSTVPDFSVIINSLSAIGLQVLSHQIAFGDLTQGERYFYRVNIRDSAGNSQTNMERWTDPDTSRRYWGILSFVAP